MSATQKELWNVTKHCKLIRHKLPDCKFQNNHYSLIKGDVCNPLKCILFLYLYMLGALITIF